MSSNSARFLLKFSAYAATIAVTTTSAIFVATPPPSAFAVAAVFPPWWSAASVRLALDPIDATSSTGRMPTVVTVYGGPGLQQRLRSAGAWLILDPRLIDCGGRPETSA